MGGFQKGFAAFYAYMEHGEHRVTRTQFQGNIAAKLNDKNFASDIGPLLASGLRMLYEMYLQFQGRAGDRQLEDPRFGLTHNLGGFPAMNVCSIAVVGKYEG